MMRSMLFVVSATAVSLFVAPLAHAQVSLSLQSRGPDLSKLRVGDTATIEVRLEGLPPGWQLDALAASVLYDDALLGAPTIAAGPIVPDPLDDPWDFYTAAMPGYAEAWFLTFGTDPAAHITSNGVFFSFDVTATDAGSGAFALDFTDATQFNPTDPFAPIHRWAASGDPLPFTVVPEPGCLALLAMAASVLGAWSRRSRRTR